MVYECFSEANILQKEHDNRFSDNGCLYIIVYLCNHEKNVFNVISAADTYLYICADDT